MNWLASVIYLALCGVLGCVIVAKANVQAKGDLIVNGLAADPKESSFTLPDRGSKGNWVLSDSGITLSIVSRKDRKSGTAWYIEEEHDLIVEDSKRPGFKWYIPMTRIVDEKRDEPPREEIRSDDLQELANQ
jgi:hypothetical protein